MYLIALFFMFTVFMFASTGRIATFIDPASAIFVFITTAALLGASGLWKDFRRAFKASFSKVLIYNAVEIRRSITAVKLTMWLLFSSGLFATIIGLVGMFSHVYKEVIPSRVFAGISVSLLTTVYSGVVILILFPILFKLKALLIDLEVQDEKDPE